MTSQTSDKQSPSIEAVRDRLISNVAKFVSRARLDRAGFIGLGLSSLTKSLDMDLGFFLFKQNKINSLGKDAAWFAEDSSHVQSYLESLKDSYLRESIFNCLAEQAIVIAQEPDQIPEELTTLREHFRFQRQTCLILVGLIHEQKLYGVSGFLAYRTPSINPAELKDSLSLMSILIGGSLSREALRFYHVSSLDRYKTLVEGLHEGVILCDEQGLLVHTNRRMAEMLGYAQEEMIGKSSYDFVHYDDRDEMIRRTAERFKMKSDRYEIRLVAKNGKIIWTYIQASPWTNPDGEVIGSIGAITDISDKKRSDNAIELMLRDTAGVTGDEFFRQLVRNLAQIFGAKYAFASAIKTDSATCQTVAVWRAGTFIDNSDYPIRSNPTEYVLEHGFTVFREGVAERFPQDRYLGVEGIVSYMGAPLFSSKGEKIGVLSLMDDKKLEHWETGELIIQVFAQRAGAELERLEAAAETKQLQHQLIQIQKMEAIGTLASGLAHDINNSMGVVRGHLELINEHCSSDNTITPDVVSKIKSSSTSAQTASLQAQDVVAQLLNFAKPKSGNKVSFSIQEVVNETISLFSTRSMGASSINVIDTRDVHKILGDRGQIQQVITNMFLNSLTAMPHGGNITVSYFTTYVKNPTFRNLNAVPGIYLQLAISDTGVGIPAEYKEKLFEPFFSTQPKKGGTGLGLSMAYTIVQQHSGWIEVESQVGKGSTFTIYLPLAPNNVNDEMQNLQRPASDSCILVVDDEPAVLDLTVQFLEQYGYDTKGFTNPLEAVEWFETHSDSVSLVILDLKMPTLDGKDCLKEFKRIRPEVDAVILSGEVEHVLHEEMLNLGAAKFFQKPLEYRLLIDWIDNEIKAKQS